jgi:hypothetical protein
MKKKKSAALIVGKLTPPSVAFLAKAFLFCNGNHSPVFSLWPHPGLCSLSNDRWFDYLLHNESKTHTHQRHLLWALSFNNK